MPLPTRVLLPTRSASLPPMYLTFDGDINGPHPSTPIVGEKNHQGDGHGRAPRIKFMSDTDPNPYDIPEFASKAAENDDQTMLWSNLETKGVELDLTPLSQPEVMGHVPPRHEQQREALSDANNNTDSSGMETFDEQDETGASQTTASTHQHASQTIAPGRGEDDSHGVSPCEVSFDSRKPVSTRKRSYDDEQTISSSFDGERHKKPRLDRPPSRGRPASTAMADVRASASLCVGSGDGDSSRADAPATGKGPDNGLLTKKQLSDLEKIFAARAGHSRKRKRPGSGLEESSDTKKGRVAAQRTETMARKGEEADDRRNRVDDSSMNQKDETPEAKNEGKAKNKGKAKTRGNKNLTRNKKPAQKKTGSAETNTPPLEPLPTSTTSAGTSTKQGRKKPHPGIQSVQTVQSVPSINIYPKMTSADKNLGASSHEADQEQLRKTTKNAKRKAQKARRVRRKLMSLPG